LRQKVEYLFSGERFMKKFNGHPHEFGVKESNGVVMSDLARPVAVKIDILPFSARGKPLIPSKRYKIDGKCCWDTTRIHGHFFDW
jgi:hypothetical protein